jgi:hypothetical protein
MGLADKAIPVQSNKTASSKRVFHLVLITVAFALFFKSASVRHGLARIVATYVTTLWDFRQSVGCLQLNMASIERRLGIVQREAILRATVN